MRRLDAQAALSKFQVELRKRMEEDHSARGTPEEVFDRITAADPSRSKRYAAWLLRAWLKGGIRHLEDLSRASYALSVFHKFKRHLPEEMRDINRIRKLNELEDVIAPYENRKSGKELKAEDRDRAYAESEIVYDGPEGMVVIPETEYASCFWGRGTKWCTAATRSENMFQWYNERGPLYILVHEDGTKWQFHMESREFTDDDDNPLSMADVKGSPLFEKWVEAAMPHIMASPMASFAYAKLVLGAPAPEELEEVIAKDPDASWEYAEFLGKRWEKGEPAIARNGVCAARYALSILESRFPQGEAEIAKDAHQALMYATEILNAPFPEAEEAISQHAYCSFDYAMTFDMRFPKGESAILKNPSIAASYAIAVLKEPWPEAEDLIASDPKASFDYANELLKGPFPKGEAAISRDSTISCRYAIEVLGERFVPGEDEIKRRIYDLDRYCAAFPEVKADHWAYKSRLKPTG